jgi:DNA-binding CsgD family transcriptional regulator
MPFQENTLLQCLAESAFRGRDLDRAEVYARESLTVVAPYNERYGSGFALRSLGWILHEKGDSAGALDAWRQAFKASCEVDDPLQIADSLVCFGRAALDADDAARAARWFGAADTLRERSGRQRLDLYEQFDKMVTLARSCLGSERFDAAWRAGSGLSPLHVWNEFEDTVLDEVKPATSSPSSLVTTREREILDLLVAGKTDREIAETLFVSVRTVEGHVSRIFAKLGVRTRTAAATAAIASGLVTHPLIQ